MSSLKHCSVFGKYNDDKYKSWKISKACVYLPNEAVFLNTNGEVYHIVNTAVTKFDIFNKKNVINIAFATSTGNGKLVFLVLTEYEIYGWGGNQYRQVSINTANDVPGPQKLTIPSPSSGSWDKFTNISCVYGHCMTLTSDNCLILWGRNSHCQIGNGTTSSIEAPYRIKFTNSLLKRDTKNKRFIYSEHKIIAISTSSRNSYVLLSNGDVYGWGDNGTGQMGTVHTNYYLSPRLIYSRIKQFVATGSYALALRNDGALFGQGDNSFGQIGDDYGQQFYAAPFKFALSKYRFKKITTWDNLCMGLTEDDRCFIWGEYGVVTFATVRYRVQIDKRKASQKTEGNLIEEQPESCKRNSVDKSVKTNLSEIDGRSNNDLLDDVNGVDENELEESDQCKSIGAESNMSSKQAEINTDDENADKNFEKEKIRELINDKRKHEKHKLYVTLKEPKESKCKSFSTIIAKRSKIMYFDVKDDDNLSNDDDEDDNDIFDLDSMIVVIYEYEYIVEEVEPAQKMDDKKENDTKVNDEVSEQLKQIQETT